jgi:hypothetical protein
MVWIKRLILSLPFLIATVLTIRMASADHFHLYGEHIAGCAFLFATPWAWLIDALWFYLPFHSKSISAALGYVFILWVPATLYSVSLWLLFLAIAKLRTPRR